MAFDGIGEKAAEKLIDERELINGLNSMLTRILELLRETRDEYDLVLSLRRRSPDA